MDEQALIDKLMDRVIGEALGVDGSEPDESAESAGLPCGTRGATGQGRA